MVLIGFCSGAYQIAEQALDHPTTGHLHHQPTFSFVPPEDRWSPSTGPAGDQTLVRALVTAAGLAARQARTGGNGTLDQCPGHRHLAGRLGHSRTPIPSPIWWLVNRFLLDNPVMATLETYRRTPASTPFWYVVPDYLLPSPSGPRVGFVGCEQSDRFRLVLLDDLDHSRGRWTSASG